MKKIVWLTDLHLVEPGQDGPQGIDPLRRLRACLDEVRALHADAERIVISADLVQLRNPGAYRVLRAELEHMPTPYRLLVGNHDDRDALLDAFPQIKRVDGFIQGADDLDGVRLVYLDTPSGDGKHHGELCQARMRWVTDQIRSVGETTLLIFLHQPPCDIGVPALDSLRLRDSDDLADLVRGRSGPTHVFCGHLHRNVSGLWAGSPFAALKSLHSQFDLDMAGPNLVRSNEPPGFGVILIGQSDIVVNYRDISAF